MLGLLLLSDRTIYGLRDRIGKGLHLMYSSSMGSIQAAVKKLLNTGDICFTEIVEKGRHKKIYSITDNINRQYVIPAFKICKLGLKHFMAHKCGMEK